MINMNEKDKIISKIADFLIKANDLGRRGFDLVHMDYELLEMSEELFDIIFKAVKEDK